MRLTHYALLSVTAIVPTGVFGWGAAGHEVVATIAQIHLHPTVFPVLCDILNFTSHDPYEPPCHLAPIATWADRTRFKMRWSAPLHYVGAVDDYPSQTCVFPGPKGWAGERKHNVLGAVRNTTDILDVYMNDNEGTHDRANEALKFLVHFLGDLHMPLHLTGRDRGGNSNKVKFGGRTTNLHSVWDGLLIAKAIRETPQNYTRPLPSRQIEWALRGTIYDSYVRRIMWEGVLDKWADEIQSWLSCPQQEHPSGVWQTVMSTFRSVLHGSSGTDDDALCPYAWAQPIHALNCEIVWPKELDELSNGVDITEDVNHDCDSDDVTTDSSSPRPPLLQLDTPEYAGVIKERLIVEKLLAQAGIRLAAVLNSLFADFGEGTGVGRRGLRVAHVETY